MRDHGAWIMPRIAKPPLGAAPYVTIPSLTSRVGHRRLGDRGRRQ
jgi:hypothetical protein